MIESDEDANIKELIFCYAELLQEATLRGILKSWVRRSQIKGCNQFVHTGVEKGIGWPENRMNVRLVVTLEVY